MAHQVRISIDRDQMAAKLARSAREPFIELLATLLAAAPSDEVLAQWAKRRPDQWIAAITMLARLVGYSERREVDVNVSFDVSQMSDSMLEARLASLVRMLEVPVAKQPEAEGVGLAAQQPGQP